MKDELIKITINSKNDAKEIYTCKGILISEVLSMTDTEFALPCSGNHTCGKCKVAVSGKVSLPDSCEKKILTEEEMDNGIRLACSCKAEGEAYITILSREAEIISWADMPQIENTEIGTGVACDIGTTTVVARLYDRKNGEILGETMQENRQKIYGADVISRIDACSKYGASILSDLIFSQLKNMISSLKEQSGVAVINEAVITGNTTMLHLFEELNPSTLAVAPFSVQSHFGKNSGKILCNIPCYLPRCIGAYVGADITCAIIASGMTEKNETALLIDIGTNGEMVLYKKGMLYCCAAAAGPAFEGAGLSMGMPASEGAIRSVNLTNGVVSYDVIGDAKACGICGSGIIAALNVMKQLEIMDEGGYMHEDFEIADSGVFVTKQDIRKIQLAKSAVCAGLLTLLDYASVKTDGIDRFYIAGGFGSSMNGESAANIGLFPPELLPKMKYIGNASLGGAAMMLLNSETRNKATELAQNAVEISLSESPAFMDRYIDCMMF